MKIGRKRAGRGTLFLLSVLLLASAALRLGANIGQAIAAEGSKTEAGSAPLVCPQPPLALAEALSAREARVRTQETAVEERLAALALADKVIESRLAKLREAEEKLRATLAIADGAAEGDLAQLTEVYQAMKPKDAAAVFEKMDAQFAAGFLGRMRPESAAAVLSGMAPDKAYMISVLLAGRNALAPKE
ncbi:Flagellar motility protein MotE, a chaperone for MotC folding [Gemmobacter aquatilis]|uniref:Flagellar motility protein MotE, a chaperone for MotC folding n=1 Tax=Gemmobacter aquatilis TaxID=933059 RepID=A0A1H7Z1U1_9RHOB|nr:hypothetical protein [Gemmobacter aquatilis]SEM52296.1 Flagellar motility protein MotE, a chaperone for MotC folding [Gemmobacter aquatilis]